MKLPVPFFKQTTPLNCGPTVLKMVLAYFGDYREIEPLEKAIGLKEGKGILTIQIATAAASFGYRTDFYSKNLLFDEEHLKRDFYQKYLDKDKGNLNKLVEEAKKAGVNLQEKTLPLEELLKYVTETSIPIVLIDWNIVKGRKENGYQGHFVPIVGFDSQNIYAHNSGLVNTKDFMPIKRNIFDKARKSDGTDEDVAVIYRSRS